MEKLTIELDDDVIARAEKYADRQGTSLASLLTAYLTLLAQADRSTEDTPVLRRLRGSLKGAVPPGSDYREILVEKHR